MSERTLPPWLLPLWQRVTADIGRLHHALLLAGPRGSGKRQFAEALAQRLLCNRPRADGFACGACPSCHWFADGNHPDMHRMVPESAEEDEGEADAEGKKEKKKSDQIRIEQVRDMQGLLEVGGHQGGRRVVLVDPAEAMNPPTANALLKSLEEPQTDVVFLLVCHAPGQLLPTIRSRCQSWVFPKPAADEAAKWLREAGVTDADALLGFASGLPLAAQELATGPLADARARFARDMLALSSGDPLKLAGEWESWLKSKAAVEGGVTLTLLVSWLQRWLADGARVARGQSPRFFADHGKALVQQAGAHAEGWLAAYHELTAFRKVSQHPLNQRLFLEDVLMRVRRGMAR
ncbi:DNA polymerase III subunit delta' [Uliginosibacterium sp. sgz301328]|uniref:DNA polymerase III subunit delta' n=1 Tax=Uliginosibacterium sp. sgz301328 TaxID=3243764 RepID=UPI00359CD3AB